MVDGFEVPGIIRFIGNHVSKGMPRVGVELDEPVGKHSGMVDGHRYFKCKAKRGVLVLPKKVKKV